MHAQVSTARRGHTVSSYEDFNLRAFVAKVAADNPRAGPNELRKVVSDTMVDEMEANPAAARAVASHWASNEVSAYLKVESAPRRVSQREAAPAENRERIERIKGQIALLTLVMPNGKPMSECTGNEMAEFGAGYARIAREVGTYKKVGEVLDEKQVRALVLPL